MRGTLQIIWLLVVLTGGLATSSFLTGRCSDNPHDAIGRLLDAFHQSAAEAQADRYFGCLAEDAIFLGTDASERWTKTAFIRYCTPYFSRGVGWKYVPRQHQRHITVGPGGQVAWFDELLDNEKYGTCRGSGVVVQTPQGWKIAQYNLSLPIPNAVVGEVIQCIRALDQVNKKPFNKKS
jgi:hypothetical protein